MRFRELLRWDLILIFLLIAAPWHIWAEWKFPGFLQNITGPEWFSHLSGHADATHSYDDVPRLQFLGLHLAWWFPKANEIIAGQIRNTPEDWFWVHNRWKTPKPHFLLSRYKRGIFVPPNESLKPFRIVIRSPNWLGDSVMAVPAVRAIKAGRPDAHITIAAPEKNCAGLEIDPGS